MAVVDVHTTDCKAVPLQAFRQVLDYLPRGHVVRVMVQMLFYTGCRTKELDFMRTDKLVENMIYWNLGKNQVGWRREELPEHFVKELHFYRATHRVPAGQLFGVSAGTFKRYFNRDVRPHLGRDWNRKRSIPRVKGWAEEYVLQLKGFRKTFQTFQFARELEKWRSAEVALEMTSKRMHHSSVHITAFHYLENFEGLGIDKYKVPKAGSAAIQARLFDYK